MLEEKIIQIENDVLSLVSLYVEAYLIAKEKGFTTKEEEKIRLVILKENIYDFLREKSAELQVSIEEIIEVIQRVKKDQQTYASESRKNYIAEDMLIEDIIGEIGERVRKEANATKYKEEEER